MFLLLWIYTFSLVLETPYFAWQIKSKVNCQIPDLEKLPSTGTSGSLL